MERAERALRRHLAWSFAVVALAPCLAAAAPQVERAPTPRGFYLLTADVLEGGFGTTQLRFEYRSAERKVSAHEVQVELLPGESRVLLIPPPIQLGAAPAEDLELLVYAGERLVGHFDEVTLREYNRQLLRRMHRIQPGTGFAIGGVEGPVGVRRIAAPAICDSPCGGGCMPSQDYDCDGVINSADNCTDDPNGGQEDCDGDSWGDVCDSPDAVYQPTGSVKTCMTDKDNHVAYFTIEHHVEQLLVDVSSCNSPDRWDRWVRSHADCSGISDQSCCVNGIGTSIGQVGDDPQVWCDTQLDLDLCH